MTQGDLGPSDLNRRRFLKGAMSTAGVGLVAGCIGGDDEPEVRTEIVTVEGGERTVVRTVEVTPEEDAEDVLPDTVALGAASPVFPVFYFPYFPIMAERMEENYGVSMEAVSYGSAVGMTGGFMQDEIQLGYLSPVEATRRINEGLPIVSPTTQVHQYYHALSVDPSIEDWSDLEGGDVAVHSPLSSATVLTEALVTKALGSADAVNYQNIIGTTNRMAALEAGEVDAAIAFLSGAIQTEEQGYGRILDSPYEYDDLTDFPVNLWFAPEPTINENEEMYRILVQEMQASYQQVYEEETEDLVERALATDVNYPEFPEEVWYRAYELAAENNMWPADYETNMSVERLEKSIQTHIDFELLEEDERLPAEDLLDDRFVGEIG